MISAESSESRQIEEEELAAQPIKQIRKDFGLTSAAELKPETRPPFKPLNGGQKHPNPGDGFTIDVGLKLPPSFLAPSTSGLPDPDQGD